MVMVEKDNLEGKLYHYKATVIKVVDGDSAWLSIDMGLNVKVVSNCRFYGVNAPELKSKDSEEKQKALKSKAFVEERLVPELKLYVYCEKYEAHTRPLVKIFYPSKNGGYVNISEELVENGMAVRFMD